VSIRTRLRSTIAIAVAMGAMAHATPAFADIPSPTDIGTGLAPLIAVACCGLLIFVGVAVLIVWLIVRSNRRAKAAAAAPPAVAEAPAPAETAAPEGTSQT